jgi:predicted GIY-YIG superfamily endonuclease
METFFCYVLFNKNDKYKNLSYCGITNNLEKRLKQHNSLISGGAKYTRSKGEWEYLFTIGCFTKNIALSLEWKLKHPDGKKTKSAKYCGIFGRILSLRKIIKENHELATKKIDFFTLCSKSNNETTNKNTMSKQEIVLKFDDSEQTKLLVEIRDLVAELRTIAKEFTSRSALLPVAFNDNDNVVVDNNDVNDDNGSNEESDVESDSGSEKNVVTTKNIKVKEEEKKPTKEAKEEKKPTKETKEAKEEKKPTKEESDDEDPFDDKTYKRMKKFIKADDKEKLDEMFLELEKEKKITKKQWRAKIKEIEADINA